MKPRSYGPFPYSPIIDRPRLDWPNGAHVALWVIPNIEFFSLQEKVPGGSGGSGAPVPDVPDVVGARLRQPRRRVPPDGGARPLRHPRHGRAQQRSSAPQHPQIIEEGEKRTWEWMGHNESNTRRLNEAAPGEEAGIIRDTLATIEKRTGQAGRRAGSAPACRRPGTRSIILADEGCEYVADWSNDDQPYLMTLDGGAQLVSMPYSQRAQRQVGVRAAASHRPTSSRR